MPYREPEKVIRHALDVSKLNDEELRWAKIIADKATTPMLVDANEVDDPD
jgi:hypothetical protein